MLADCWLAEASMTLNLMKCLSFKISPILISVLRVCVRVCVCVCV